MIRKRQKAKIRRPVEVKAAAELKAVAKASYDIKKNIEQKIPEDVTRARTHAWLDLISPITEWAGLKGDELRHKRSLLRIQQDEALAKLGSSIQAKMRDKEVITPLPPKILVPALEAASLEEPDSPLIDWWADLLVSGATRAPLRPYFIDLMSVLGPAEAKFLEWLWGRFSKSIFASEAAFGGMSDVSMSIRTYFIDEINIDIYARKIEFQDSVSNIQKAMRQIGVLVDVFWESASRRDGVRRAGLSRSVISPTVRKSLNVCLSSNIISCISHAGTINWNADDPVNYHVLLYHFSEVGGEFMLRCRPKETENLEFMLSEFELDDFEREE